jgi:hypothetical protein
MPVVPTLAPFDELAVDELLDEKLFCKKINQPKRENDGCDTP